MRALAVPLIALLPVVGACGVLGPGASLAVEMDSATYTMDSTGWAHATFAVHNTSDGDIYFNGCTTPITANVERRSGSVWGSYLVKDAACPANIQPATLVLHPGQRYRDTFSWDSPGVYRLRVLYGLNSTDTYSHDALGAAFEFR